MHRLLHFAGETHLTPDDIAVTMASKSKIRCDLNEGFALRIRQNGDADAGIDSDSDETLKQSCTSACDQHGASSRDSAMSSRETSLASSVAEPSASVWLQQAVQQLRIAEPQPQPEPEPESGKSPDERQNYRRASSLKSSRSTDGPSSLQKKAVRFADALGLDLTAVKQLMDVEFGNPPSWCQMRPDVLTRKALRPAFEQPAARLGAAYRQKVLDNLVLLENLMINELTMIGSVRVANIGYDKRVFVRFTTDCWLHFADKEATYVPLSCDGGTDRFSFTITAPADIHEYGLAEFCVCYVANGVEHWDSNGGRNYVCEVFMEDLGAPYGTDFTD